jgi:hypothetical protein
MSILGQAQKHVYIGTATKHVYIGAATKTGLYWDSHKDMSQYRHAFVAIPV